MLESTAEKAGVSLTMLRTGQTVAEGEEAPVAEAPSEDEPNNAVPAEAEHETAERVNNE